MYSLQAPYEASFVLDNTVSSKTCK